MEYYRWNRIYTQHKIISNDNKIILSDLKLEKYIIEVRRLSHSYRYIPFPREKTTVMFDGVILEYKKHFKVRSGYNIFNKTLDKYGILLKYVSTQIKQVCC